MAPKGKRQRLLWAAKELAAINRIEAELCGRKLRLERVLEEIAGAVRLVTVGCEHDFGTPAGPLEPIDEAGPL